MGGGVTSSVSSARLERESRLEFLLSGSKRGMMKDLDLGHLSSFRNGSQSPLSLVRHGSGRILAKEEINQSEKSLKKTLASAIDYFF